MKNPPPLASHCPICGQSGRLRLDFPQTLHGHRFSLHSCNACGLGYTFPTPPEELLEKIYSGEYWMREKTVQKQGAVLRLVHKFNELRLVATIKPLLRRLKPGAFILEVGSGSGQVAAYLKRTGYHVEVTDISQDILNEIKRLHGIDGYCGSLEEIGFSHVYDAIILNNVLEHLPDPVQTLKRAEQLLTPRGLVFIEVPNIASFQFKLFRKFWFPLQIPQHLFHFSPASLQEIAHQASLGKIWCSTFSPRISSAGYVASIFPGLRPERIRLSWSKLHLFLYLGLQTFFLPLALTEARAGKGSAIRALFQKKSAKP
jgi:2-polyprenyl-3-methyl-5-hydroxy-6-metoxy-1,4-benzoquinol methylase